MSPVTNDTSWRKRWGLSEASWTIRGVMSTPTTRLPAAASSKAMSPVPQARSSAAASFGAGDLGDQPPLPAVVESARQQDSDQVVAVGDGREQRPDVLALALRRGEPILPFHFARRILPDIITECGVQM